LSSWRGLAQLEPHYAYKLDYIQVFAKIFDMPTDLQNKVDYVEKGANDRGVLSIWRKVAGTLKLKSSSLTIQRHSGTEWDKRLQKQIKLGSQISKRAH